MPDSFGSLEVAAFCCIESCQGHVLVLQKQTSNMELQVCIYKTYGSDSEILVDGSASDIYASHYVA